MNRIKWKDGKEITGWKAVVVMIVIFFVIPFTIGYIIGFLSR